MQNITKRRLKRSAIVIALLYIMIGSILYFLQEQFLFHPTTMPQDYVFNFEHQFEEVFLETSEDAVINALHFQVDQPEGVILYFHGNARNLKRWGRIVQYFVDMNFDVFVMDYRGYGKSTGPLSEAAFYEDARACYNYVLQRYAEEDITVYGRSLGSAMASKVASENQPKRLILEAPFYSVIDVAQRRVPIYPADKLLHFSFPNNEHLKNVNCPITIFHGTDDYVVPFSSGKKLADEFSDHKMELVTIEGGGHSNLKRFDAFKSAMQRILKN